MIRRNELHIFTTSRLLLCRSCTKDNLMFGVLLFVDLIDGIDDMDYVLHINRLVGTDKNAGFGIADGILDGMVDHIKTALYLVNTKDTKK